MNLKKIRLISSILTIIINISLFSESSSMYLFDSLTLEDGLSNSSVSSIQQDSKGFLWFGTQSGLNRYDGYDFITYNHNTFDTNSLPHGLVQSLFIDDEDIIWIGTYNGVSRFDPSTTKFTNYEYNKDDNQSISNNVVTAMDKDQYGNIWIGTLGGLNKLDTQSGSLERYLNNENEPDSLMNDTVRSVLVDSKDRIWIGNLKGLDLYNEKTDNFIHYAYDENSSNSLPSPYVMKILEEKEDTLLVGTWDGGLTRLNVETRTYETFSFIDNRIYSMEKDNHNQVWIGTWGGGLFIFDLSEHSTLHLKEDDSDTRSILADTIYSLFMDNTNIMWMGTNGAGINKHNPLKKDYSFLVQENSENIMNSAKIDSMMEDVNGDIWIGIYNEGINRYTPETGIIKNYKHDENDKTSLSNDIVSGLLEDSSGTIWASTNIGLNIYNPESDDFKRVYLNPLEDNNASYTYSILYEDSRGEIWIGSNNDGLFKYNRTSGEIINYKSSEDDPHTISDNLIYSILERDNGEFWIGTNKGLNLLDRDSGTFKRYFLDRNNPNGLNNNAIRVLLEDREKQLWIGTAGGGINIYNDKENSFSHYTTRDGLSNNVIMSMEEDSEGNIWIGTKYGVSIINKKKGSIDVLNQEDGLLTMEFTNGSLKGSDNSIYLGSIHGINRFEIYTSNETNEIQPVIHLNSIEISGEEILGFSPYLPLQDMIIDYKDRNYLSFNFTALNYLNPHKTRYAHKLVGFDEDWIYDQNRRFALYTNIPPGEYKFKVKAANSDGIWNEKELIHSIRIKPPLWLSWWAYILYTILIFAILYLLNAIRTRQLKLQKLIERKKAEDEIKALSTFPRENTNPVLRISSEGTILHANDASSDLLEFWGCNKGESIPDEMVSFTDRLLKNGLKENLEFKIIDKSLLLSFVPIKEMNYINIYGMDITELKLAEEKLAQSQKMESIGQLAGGMAHDFNNVLSGIMSASQLLTLPDNELNEKNLKYVDMIFQSSVRASNLIQKLLAFSRKGENNTTSLDVHKVLKDTVDILEQTIDKKIAISLSLEAHNHNIVGNFSAIESAFLNLGINASQAMPEGGVIQIRTENIFLDQNYCDTSSLEVLPGNFLQIEIKDMGCGIPQENLQKIFEPFYTTKEQGSGTGLGLSAVYGTIQNHHGIIEVQSTIGSGTTFTIMIPSSEKIIEKKKELSPIFSGVGTILVVDDEEMNRNLNKDIFESLGYQVLLAEDGLESIDIFSKNHSEIDIVLMDMIMPKMNGAEAFYKMKEIDENVKVIISSGYIQDENIDVLIKNGLAGFINKPYKILEISQLLDKVRNKN